MNFNPKESAQWTQVADKVVGDLQSGVEKVLASDAGRGFPAPTGDTLWAILQAGQEAKAKLTEADGKIYDDRRQDLFGIDEFELKVIVRVAKLAMELYREQIFNALALEQSQAAATTERQRADVDRLNAETEFRTVAIIHQKAEMEQSIIVFRQQLVAAETQSLAAERVLIQAQLETAEKKLEIIDSIYKVLAAEQLVLAAEKRRAASLQKVLEARAALAAIKKEMVPFYQEKAKARQDLATAITQEIPIREAIERLGYGRLALKDAEELADHAIRMKEGEHNLAQEARTRAEMALQLTRAQAHRILQEYSNQIRGTILDKKQELEELQIDFKFQTALAREGIGVGNEVSILNREKNNLTQELTNLLSNMDQQAQDQATTISASARQVLQTGTSTIATKKTIQKG